MNTELLEFNGIFCAFLKMLCTAFPAFLGVKKEKHNAKLDLYMHCVTGSLLCLALLKNGCITCNDLNVFGWIDGESAQKEGNSDSCQHTSPVCPSEESDELKPG